VSGAVSRILVDRRCAAAAAAAAAAIVSESSCPACSMLLVVDASAALRGLYDIGYARLLPTATATGGSGAAAGGAGTAASRSPSAAASASVGPTDGVLDFDPRNGVMADIPRKSSGDDAPAAVRRLFVVGSKGAGKVGHSARHHCWLPISATSHYFRRLPSRITACRAR